MLVRSISIIFLISLFFSCKNEKNKTQDIPALKEENYKKEGKLDLENFDLKKFSYQEFYKQNKYENTHEYFSNDSIEHQNIRLYSIEKFGFPRTSLEENPEYYFEDYSYYKENDENMEVGENIEDIATFEPIAYFGNQFFDFAHFVVNKKTNATEAAIFLTIPGKEEKNYEKKVQQIIEKIGNPIHHKKVTDSNSGNNFDAYTWQINNTIYQLVLNGSNENRIELLIIDKKSVPFFDSDFNSEFGFLFNKKDDY